MAVKLGRCFVLEASPVLHSHKKGNKMENIFLDEKFESSTTNTTNTTNITNITNRTNSSFVHLNSETRRLATPIEVKEEVRTSSLHSVKPIQAKVLSDTGREYMETFSEIEQAKKETGNWIEQNDVSYCKFSLFVQKNRLSLNMSMKAFNTFKHYRASLTQSKYDFINNVKRWDDYKTYKQYMEVYNGYKEAKELGIQYWGGKFRTPKAKRKATIQMNPILPLATTYVYEQSGDLVIGVYLDGFRTETRIETHLVDYTNEGNPIATLEYRPSVDRWAA